VVLALAAVISLGYFGGVEFYLAHRPPREAKVVYKTEAELAKLVPVQDDYPCLLLTPTHKPGSAGRWTTEVRWCLPSLSNDADIEQYEVDLRSGMFVLRQTDLFIDDVMPLALTRTYRLWDTGSRAFGIGANQPYDMFPYGPRFPYSNTNVLLPDGHSLYYNRISEGTSYADAVFEHTGTPPTVFDKSRIWWNKDHWDYSFQDGRLYQFPEAYRSKRGAEGALVAMRDGAGHEIKLARDAARNLVGLSSPGGHSICLGYDAANRIISATDDSGRALAYSYSDGGMLYEVQRSGRRLWRFSYDVNGMTEIRDSNDKALLRMGYSHGLTQTVQLANGPTFHVDYLFNSSRTVIEASVWNQRDTDKVTRFRFDVVSKRWQGGQGK
jgi:YD repeat-containing protein